MLLYADKREGSEGLRLLKVQRRDLGFLSSLTVTIFASVVTSCIQLAEWPSLRIYPLGMGIEEHGSRVAVESYLIPLRRLLVPMYLRVFMGKQSL